ncbi:MAG: glycosyltransferase, partial [Ignavibacteriaceae bacterium]
RETGKVLFVGRLAAHKGCEFLIEAVQDLDVKLSIVSPEKDSDRVRFLKTLDKNGKVNFNFGLCDKELVHEYCTSNVTILPSVYLDYFGNYHPIPELLGLTLLESMACETPVICTNVGGMPEIVKDGKTGFIVNPGDVNGLRDSIEYFVSNPKEVDFFGKSGRAEVMKSYTWDSIVKHCLSVYEEFC